ncbi:Xaa-Pro aminopeptidase [Sinosporangium album]|uniref:Xaa-Pro aminopeptidase n=1 Tax=Sinosporangium album TaxID=504805 RepID=A0A1G7ZV72_9ACTN|nr:M24 family metallopeptidase [Sinosporangium album]SDH12578.1 Xaa-Pro aminopeptidase [Sinosporangium album]
MTDKSTSAGKPRLSPAERDRRHALVRGYLRDAEVDAVIASGFNAFYLTNGLPGENFAILPTDESTPLTGFVNGRHIADIPVQTLLDAQDWVTDIRPASDFVHSPMQVGDTAAMVGRIKELGIGRGGRVGVDAGLSHLVVEQLSAALPGVELVQLADVFISARTLKSEEEQAMIQEACRIWDSAVESIRRFARPGRLGAEIVHEGIRAMWDEGADMDTWLFLSFGKHASQNPAVAELCHSREVQRGDMLTLTAMARYGGYAGHTDHQISVGEPSALHTAMFESIRAVREEVLSHVKPGALHSELTVAYRKAAQETPFQFSHHSQIHQFGIAVPEYPGSKHRVKQEFVPGKQEQPDFVLAPGMVYSISPTLISADGKDTFLGGTALVVTEDGYRMLQKHEIEILVTDGA